LAQGANLYLVFEIFARHKIALEYIVHDYSIESDLSSGLFEKLENQRKNTKLADNKIHSALQKSPKKVADSSRKGPVKVLLVTAHRSGMSI
jgi:hypothetical protein